MQRKKRTKRQRAARNARWQKRWQRSKYLPRKSPVAATATVATAATLTLDMVHEAMRKVAAVPPVPFLASCALLPSDRAITFKDGGRDHVGAHPSVWAKLPPGRGLPGFEAVTIWDLDADTLRDKRAQFFAAMSRAMGFDAFAPAVR